MQIKLETKEEQEKKANILKTIVANRYRKHLVVTINHVSFDIPNLISQ